eukprot:TRINITY_DN71628_c1_g1_i1.p2 TRINITY_DN71628_c1_g1~~TRINITY_DN71628_c1_g1_i1.p2  ORF type:complete len:278 (+),score=40.87 TRINITY_DN71628_c1_g1_i1:1919-2752(+)
MDLGQQNERNTYNQSWLPLKISWYFFIPSQYAIIELAEVGSQLHLFQAIRRTPWQKCAIYPHIEDDSSAVLRTDTTYGPDERREEPFFEARDLEEYLEILNHEFYGHMKLLSISVQKQELQLQEKLAERELLSRGDRRRLKEQLMKGAQKSTIRPKKVIVSECKGGEAKPMAMGNTTKDRLKEFAKKLQMKSEEIADSEEDEEEIVDLEDSDENTNTINEIYKSKREEINKVREAFAKEIEACKARKFPVKLLERLKEKEMRTIAEISAKFRKQMLA